MITAKRKSRNGKSMKKLVAGLVVALGLAAAGEASAQEILITGPLAGAPAIKKERLYREGRFEIAPTLSFTLLDEYNRTIFAGARLQYNITEWLAIGVWGAYGVSNSQTDLASQIDQQAPRSVLTATNVAHTSGTNGAEGYAPLGNQIGKLDWVATPQIQFTPFRGKLALFQKIFVDTDAYLHAGAAFVGIKERATCGYSGAAYNSCADPNSFSLASETKIAPSFGLGLNFYLSNFISLGLEYRAIPFSWNRGGFDTRGGGPNGNFPDGKIDSNDDTFKFNQMFTIALGFSFPTSPKLSK
jgi:outer membrane beta-barrel protein